MNAYQIVAGCLFCFVSITNAGWLTERPFEDARTPYVEFRGSSEELTSIETYEFIMPTNTIMARMNFDDENTTLGPPEITGFDDGKNNSALGARTEKQGVDWFLLVEFPQDYERPEQRQYGFYLDTGAPGPGHRVLLDFHNLNDNAPYLTPLQDECSVDENTAVTINSTTCTFTLIDRDGHVDATAFPILDNPLFSVDYLEVLDEYTAVVGLLVASPGVDFEANATRTVEIGVSDGLNETFLTLQVQVRDLPDT